MGHVKNQTLFVQLPTGSSAFTRTHLNSDMLSSNNTAIIEGDPPRPQATAKDNAIMISSDEEDASAIAEKKISDLKYTIKRLKRVRGVLHTRGADGPF